MADAFRQILSQAGVPDALVSVNPACEGIYLPSASMRGERRWSFAPDTDVVSALDPLVASVGLASTAYSAPEKRGMTWGVNQAGLVRLAPAYEHVAGKYLLGASVRSATSDGWVIDDADIDPEDFVVDFETARDLEGYANMLQMISGQGVDADSRIVYDEDSWETPANSRFIGEFGSSSRVSRTAATWTRSSTHGGATCRPAIGLSRSRCTTARRSCRRTSCSFRLAMWTYRTTVLPAC